jgi:ABC-type phosphate transport system substrate-binding protein
MPRLLLLLSFIGCLAAVSLPVYAEEGLAIVVSAADGRVGISLKELKRIYQRKTQVDAKGRRIIPVNLPSDHPLRRFFSQNVFDALPEEMDEYWNIQYFHGVLPPQILSSEEAVMRFVEATPGAIGYVFTCAVDKRVKILTVLPKQDLDWECPSPNSSP